MMFRLAEEIAKFRQERESPVKTSAVQSMQQASPEDKELNRELRSKGYSFALGMGFKDRRELVDLLPDRNAAPK